MTIEEIKAIPIAAFLARMGYEPARRRGDEYWYLAPYREERTASFQVNVRKEIWHDFGTGQGGDIFNLAGEFIGSGDFKAQARFITETWGGLAPEHKTVSRTDGNNREDLLKKESFTDVRFGPLYNRVLLRYLAERGISSDVAVPNCREVRYTLHGKRYFAIGFRNVSDGYELRNRFFKASLSPKDIFPMPATPSAISSRTARVRSAWMTGWCCCPMTAIPLTGRCSGYTTLLKARTSRR